MSNDKCGTPTTARPMQTLRLLLAEMLLGWAFSVAPKDHPDTVRLVQCLMAYAAGSLKKEAAPPNLSRQPYGLGGRHETGGIHKG
jgi:hypothetical protein